MAWVVFARIEVVRRCCSQFDDPTPEFLAELIQLYFNARRDVLVPRQHQYPSRRNVALELRHQIRHVDAGIARDQMVDHHAGAGEQMLISILPQPIQCRCGLPRAVDGRTADDHHGGNCG
jgi:hypothetical protein